MIDAATVRVLAGCKVEVIWRGIRSSSAWHYDPLLLDLILYRTLGRVVGQTTEGDSVVIACTSASDTFGRPAWSGINVIPLSCVVSITALELAEKERT